ncbi:hypothetical protein TNCV_5019161 [Trichonephila clavipes]|nr:hypothetical protein TNCV_5019161 [Trichonephila clavipes]
MSDLSDIQIDQIVRVRLAGASVSETFQLLSVSGNTVSKIMTVCTQSDKTNSAKQNSGRKEKLSGRDRRVLKRIAMPKKRTTAAKRDHRTQSASGFSSVNDYCSMVPS